MSTVKRKCQVVMLPTEKAGILCTRHDKPFVLIHHKNIISPAILTTHSHFNIYIASDDEIKEGDWCILNDKPEDKYDLLQFSKRTWNAKSDNPNDYGYSKIIATTDLSLDLPQPSEGFIQKFIKAYNEGNPITEVLVEYDIKCSKESCEAFSCDANPIGCNYPIETLKVNPKDNTITITKSKDSWSREELPVDIINNVIKYCEDKQIYDKLGMYGDFYYKAKKWIEENI